MVLSVFLIYFLILFLLFVSFLDTNLIVLKFIYSLLCYLYPILQLLHFILQVKFEFISHLVFGKNFLDEVVFPDTN